MAGDVWPFASLLREVVDNRGRTCPTAASGRPLIATNCVSNGELYPTYEKVRFVDEATYGIWFRGHPQPGDLLFVTKGTPGRVCMAPDPVDFCIAQDMVAIRADEKKIYPRYLFALLRSAAVQKKIEQLHVGTLIPHFKKGDFDKLLLPVPDRATQVFVGDTYFHFSAKIELSRRMNETLDAMSRTIFKSWFVDFEPVRAKAEGRDPDLPSPIADLFPDRFEDSELGEIPAGWSILGLDEAAKFLNGLALQNYPPDGPEFLPVVKIAQLRSGATDGADRASAELTRDYIVQNGDVLFSWSGSLECVLWCGGRGALNQHLFKVTSNAYPRWFYYLWIHEHLPGFRAIAEGKATTMGHIQRHHLSEAKVVVPSPGLMTAGDRHVASLIQSIIDRTAESVTLAALRDALLTKLISGELTVKDAEHMAAETA